MLGSRAEVTEAAGLSHGRCRCGHLPTHHMVVGAVGGGFRLAPSGPCALCGEATCRRYVPSGR